MKKQIRLILISILSFIGYVLVYLVSFYKLRVNDYHIPPLNTEIIYCLIFLAFYLFIMYGLLYWWREKIDWSKSLLILIVGVIVFSAIMLACWPLTSSDIFTYIMQGRILGVYHGNPYVDYIQNYDNDALYAWVFYRWHETPMVYGPLWGIISAGLALVSGKSLVINLFIFRLFVVACFGVSTWLLYKILEKIKPNIKYFGTFMFAWNPLVLWQTANAGHNDMAMVMLALLAMWLYLKKKYLWVLPILVLACLIKYIFVLILPFVFILLIQKHKKLKEKIIFIVKNIIIILLIIISSLIFFDWGQGLIESVKFQGSLYWMYYLALLPTLLTMLGKQFIASIDADSQAIIIKTLCTKLYILLYGALLIRYFWYKKVDFKILNLFIILIFSSYLLTASFLLNEWYLLWLMPWLIFYNKKIGWSALLMITLAGLLSSNVLAMSLNFVMILAVYFIGNSLLNALRLVKKK